MNAPRAKTFTSRSPRAPHTPQDSVRDITSTTSHLHQNPTTFIIIIIIIIITIITTTMSHQALTPSHGVSHSSARRASARLGGAKGAGSHCQHLPSRLALHSHVDTLGVQLQEGSDGEGKRVEIRLGASRDAGLDAERAERCWVRNTCRIGGLLLPLHKLKPHLPTYLEHLSGASRSGRKPLRSVTHT